MAGAVQAGDHVKLRGGKVVWTVEQVTELKEGARAVLVNPRTDAFTPYPGALVSDLRVVGRDTDESRSE